MKKYPLTIIQIIAILGLIVGIGHIFSASADISNPHPTPPANSVTNAMLKAGIVTENNLSSTDIINGANATSGSPFTTITNATQTIFGTKTFNTLPLLPTSTPAGQQAVSAAYLSSQLGSAAYALNNIFTTTNVNSDNYISPVASTTLGLFIFNNTSTITALKAVNTYPGDSIAFNYLICPSIATAIANCGHLFNVTSTFGGVTSSTSATAPDLYNNFASTSVPANSVLRFYSPIGANVAQTAIHTESLGGTASTSVQVTLTNVSSSDFIAVGCTAAANAGVLSVSSITDSSGDTYTFAASTTVGVLAEALYSAKGVAAGTHNITCTGSAQRAMSVFATEVKNVQGDLDGVATTTGGAVSVITMGTITPSVSNDFAIAIGQSDGNAIGTLFSPGFTAGNSESVWDNMRYDYKITTSTVGQTATSTGWSTATNVEGILGLFKGFTASSSRSIQTLYYTTP